MPAVQNPKKEEIARQFGLEPPSQSVLRLTKLVAKRNADVAEIAALVKPDPELTASLLRAANPRADCVEDYTTTTVEDGLVRVGMNWMILLAMTDPLLRAVHKTFASTFGLNLRAPGTEKVPPLAGLHVLGEVSFAGRASGVVHLRMSRQTAANLSAQFLGIALDDLHGDGDVDDVIGELTNVVTGNFHSNLCDANLPCTLKPPRVRRTDNFNLHKPTGNMAERTTLLAPNFPLFVDISANPWNSTA